MLRQLIVLRHAKSDWNSGAMTDHERPLNRRGRTDAPKVAAAIVAQGWAPQYVVSSDARRTQETWERMADTFAASDQGEPQVCFTRHLYHAGPYALEEVLRAAPNAVHRIMAIGHNPGWEEVVYWLCGEPTSMTTANAALLSVEAESWSEALRASGEWHLHEVVRPREID